MKRDFPRKIFKMLGEFQQFKTALLAEVGAILDDRGSSCEMQMCMSQRGPSWLYANMRTCSLAVGRMPPVGRCLDGLLA